MGGFDAVHQRHPDIEEADIGTQLVRLADCLATVGGCADDFDVGSGVQLRKSSK